MPEPGPAVVLVLGAAVWPGGAPSPTLRRRALHGAHLVQTGRADHLIGCGGVGRHPPAEAVVIVALARTAGVTAVSEEAASTSTRENLRLAQPLLHGLGAGSVIIVTDWYHAPRAWIIAWGIGIRANLSCPTLAGTSWQGQAKSALREVPALMVAVVRAGIDRLSVRR